MHNAKSRGITYSDKDAVQQARALVEHDRPDLEFRLDSEYVAAASVLRAEKSDKVNRRPHSGTPKRKKPELRRNRRRKTNYGTKRPSVG